MTCPIPRLSPEKLRAYAAPSKASPTRDSPRTGGHTDPVPTNA
jgi:hypothetical protein